jgi:hypothetical protein
VEKIIPKNVGFFCNFQKMPKVGITQGAKFAQSGHPNSELLFE